MYIVIDNTYFSSVLRYGYGAIQYHTKNLK